MSVVIPLPIRDQCTHSAYVNAPVNPASAVYGRSFWLAYLGNTLMMIGYGLLYRYADFVFYLGGTELHIGWIVGVGTTGSLCMRMFMGAGIDRYGPRLIWTASLLLMSAACFGHLLIDSHSGWPIYLLRVMFACGAAGASGSSVTYISNRVPNSRVAELVGMLGTAGYVGMMFGSFLGDVLFRAGQVEKWQIESMFLIAGVTAAAAIPFIRAATGDLPRPVKRRNPSMFRLLLRYNPGFVIVVGMITGLGLGMPEIFLRAFAVSLDISTISVFFSTYALATVLLRLSFMRFFSRFSTKTVILFGLTGLAASMLSFLVVRESWHLVIPGIGFGVTQAILSPTVIAAGNTRFPTRFRGLGSIFILAVCDSGCFFGSPAAGLILNYSGKAGLPAYPILFALMSLLILLVGLGYYLIPVRKSARQSSRRRKKYNFALHGPHYKPSRRRSYSFLNGK